MTRAMIVLILMAFSIQAVAQGNKPALEQLKEKKQTEKAATVLRTLTQFHYRAGMDIPAGDSLFIDDGKLTTGIYRAALKAGIAIKAGEMTNVSKVTVLDFGIQIHLGKENCSIIGFATDFATEDKTAAQIAALAKKTLQAMFEVYPTAE